MRSQKLLPVILTFLLTTAAACSEDTVPSVPSGDEAVCGDSVVGDGEKCDDGNTQSGDGCSADCKTVEANYTCPKEGGKCTPKDDPGSGTDPNPNKDPVCGNGILENDEICDDGNTTSGDGCSDNCKQIEPGFICPEVGQQCQSLCGNGRLDSGEMCDDGNTKSGDGCSADCKSIESGYTCPLEGNKCASADCGNDTIEGDEECDYGALNVEYGSSEADCGLNCEIAHYCGDGLLSPVDLKNGEECDAGGHDTSNEYNGCTLDCKKVNYCGDGIVSHDEICDDGNTTNGDGCSDKCQIESGYRCSKVDGKSMCYQIHCGNGTIEDDEECDDGNTQSGDGCSSLCFVEKGYSCTPATASKPSVCTTTCGNGIVEAEYGEKCDDGNQIAGDGCSPACQVEAGYLCEDNHCIARACGDGIRAGEEECDDGNTANNDGCAKNCKREEGYYCPTPGKPCLMDKCGDGLMTGDETCDDGNTTNGDGCSNTCQIEFGWVCDENGKNCTQSASCGNGKLEGIERCDEGNNKTAGCTDKCQIVPGWRCPTPGAACIQGSCGDGELDEGEQCDDGNLIAGDGCSPVCEIEAIYECNTFGCKPTCGDNLVIEGEEECDDGNLINGDGCSSTCKIERGYACEVKTSGTPATLNLPIVYHDFIKFNGHSASDGTDGYVSSELYNSLPASCKPGASTYRYASNIGGYNSGYLLQVGRPSPDFNSYCPASHCLGVVKDMLGKDGTPDLAPMENIYSDGTEGTNCKLLYTCPEVFKWWYHDVPGINKRIEKTLSFNKVAGKENEYLFDSKNSFWPLGNNDGYGFAGSDGSGNGEFTSHFQTYFKYSGGETLTFDGDDDVWVFFNGRLGVDVGGIHPQWQKSITLDTATAASKFHMYPGGIYAIDMFHAERCRGGSSYKLTLSGFVSMGKSTCDAVCGDGIIRGDEECDIAGHIADDVAERQGCFNCRLKPFCGNGKIEAGEQCDGGEAGVEWCDKKSCKLKPDTCGNGKLDEHEQCDYAIKDATNPDYRANCLNTCRISGCGDGIVDTAAGEECDDANSSNDDMCTTLCKRPYCGDGIVTPSLGEVCDDGKNDGTYGGCGLNCAYETPRCGDGIIDTLNGEECDDGAQNKDNTYNVCSTKCKLGVRCGDGIVQREYGEECDYADPKAPAHCSSSCIIEIL